MVSFCHLAVKNYYFHFVVLFLKICFRDFPGGPVVKTMLSLQGTQPQSLVRELRPHMLHGQLINKCIQLNLQKFLL